MDQIKKISRLKNLFSSWNGLSIMDLFVDYIFAC